MCRSNKKKRENIWCESICSGYLCVLILMQLTIDFGLMNKVVFVNPKIGTKSVLIQVINNLMTIKLNRTSCFQLTRYTDAEYKIISSVQFILSE